MSKKQEFIKYMNNVLTYIGEVDAPLAPMNEDAKLYWDAFCGLDENGEKPLFTDNGKLILKFLQDHIETPMWKARDIAEGLFISSRAVSGAMRKLVTDGFVEKVGQDPVIYSITENGKNINEFDKITDDMNELVKINDKIYLVDGKSFRHLKRYTWLLQKKDKSNEILQYAIQEKYMDLEFILSDNFRKLIKTSNIYEEPKTLNGKLRPYQKIGYSWLIQNIKSGFGSILADDMGLGKTLQVLAAILYFKEKNQLDAKPSVIIVPPTLISNWQQEIEKFTPELSYYIYHGPNRHFPSEYYDIILTSYAIIRSDLEMFINEPWFICIIDEAQNIKNPNTLR